LPAELLPQFVDYIAGNQDKAMFLATPVDVCQTHRFSKKLLK